MGGVILSAFADIGPGDTVPSIEAVIDRLALVRYAGASDDYVAQHWDHPLVLAQGYPDVIAHGWLVFAHMCRAVTHWAPASIATIAHYEVRYHRPFHPGPLLCSGEVTAVTECSAEITLWGRNSAGKTVATGSVTLRPTPPPPSQQV